MSQMDIAVKHIKSPHQTLNVLWSLKHRKAQREGIHQPTNQTPHLSQLKFKLDPLNIPNEVTILWTCVFHVCSHLMVRLAFYLVKFLFF